jgi:hypothetical protein
MECPVCFNSLTGALVSCSNKHNICIPCFMDIRIKHCPVCRDDYHKPEIVNDNISDTSYSESDSDIDDIHIQQALEQEDEELIVEVENRTYVFHINRTEQNN